MSIEAFCPNGHRIVCPDESAGRAARCPKCTSPFRIPGGTTPETAGESSSLTSTDSESPHSESQSTASANSTEQPVPRKPIGEQIIFLCPNGHQLNGPAKLAGRLGQCPHCHEKFQIPPLEVIRAVQAAGEVGSTPSNLESVEYSDSGLQSNSGSQLGSSSSTNLVVEDIAATYEEPADLDNIAAAVRAVEERRAQQRASTSGMNLLGQPNTAYYKPAPQQPTIHTLADLVIKLWEEREHGGIIELHLTGGVVLLPDWFEKKLSTKDYGLFAAQAADSSVTMTIVPWETVERVIIRGVVGLPDGMFE